MPCHPSVPSWSCTGFPGAVVTQCEVAGESPEVPAEGPRLLFASGLALLLFIVKLKVKTYILIINYIAT